MDLTQEHPRSAKQKMDGIYSLARAIDKARAFNEGKLGDYHYDCPHDKPLFEFLGTDAQTFAQKSKELDDAGMEKWVKETYLSKKKPAELEAFNQDRLAWKPDPGTDSEKFFKSEAKRLGRPEVTTWFDLIDLDEGRPVPVAR